VICFEHVLHHLGDARVVFNNQHAVRQRVVPDISLLGGSVGHLPTEG
jgi:hypothetical protein